MKDYPRCAKLGYGAGSRGTAAYRVERPVFLLIPTGIVKRKIRFLAVGRVDAEGNPLLLSQGRKPTGEAFLHGRQRGAGMTCPPGRKLEETLLACRVMEQVCFIYTAARADLLLPFPQSGAIGALPQFYNLRAQKRLSAGIGTYKKNGVSDSEKRFPFFAIGGIFVCKEDENDMQNVQDWHVTCSGNTVFIRTRHRPVPCAFDGKNGTMSAGKSISGAGRNRR